MAIVFDKLTKVIEIESPAIEVTIQDLVNAIRDWQDEIDNLETLNILNAAGKEALGGGVSVGITMTLLDGWKVAFEARGGPSYTQCTVSGGNLVSSDESNPISPTAFTQIVVTASSSATTADLDAIQYSSYGGGVSVDVINGASGTDYPIGNQEFPVDNISDAVAIANSKGFKTLYIRESMTISSITISDFHLIGRSHVNTFITMDTSAICDGVTIENANITGVLDGGTHITECSVGDITYVNGHIHHCGLYGTTILDGNEDAVIEDCFTVDQDNSPIIDMGGTGQDLALPNYSGVINIKNFSDATGEIGVGLNTGSIILESTITAGTVVIAGSGLLTNNTTGTATVNTDGLINRELITKANWDIIYYDTASTETGTDFPVGTLNHPVNNLTDLKIISAANNIHNILLHSDITLDSSVEGLNFNGEKQYLVDLNGQTTLGSTYSFCLITGIQSNPAKFDRCRISDVTNICGSFKECVFPDATAITTSSSFPVVMIDCATAMEGTNPLLFDLTNGSCDLQIKRYSGGIKIINSTDTTNIMGIGVLGGMIILDSTCTLGACYIGGLVGVTDNSGASFNVNIDSKAASVDNIWDEPSADHLTAGSTGKALSDAGGSGNPWSTPISGNTTAGTFGELVGKKLLTFAKWMGLK